MIRSEAIAGIFYEKDKNRLSKQIEECFLHKLGPGIIGNKINKDFVSAIISPHAGYAYSGMAAAFGFKEISESKTADLYLFLGPDHHGDGSSISLDDWKTPLGTLKTDKAFAKELSKKTGLFADENVQLEEHSIEVELPFLQFAQKENASKIRICAVMISNDIDVEDFSRKLKRILSEQKKKITIIVSSDFTHYGSGYGYLPFTSEVDKNLERLDRKAIDFILKKDAKGFQEHIQNTGDTICGYLPIYILLNILDEEKGILLKYYRSSKISGDNSNSVSYASIMFK